MVVIIVNDEVAQAKLAQLKAMAPSACAEAMNITAEEGRGMAEDLAPKDTGTLSGDIDVEYATPVLLIARIRAMTPYAGYVELVNAGPRTAPHWVEVKYLEGWSSRHGVNPYALRLSIGKRGTPQQKFMVPTADKIPERLIINANLLMNEIIMM